MRGKFVLGWVVGASALLFAAPSWAGEPVTANSLQLGLGFRYGFEMNDGDFNPWGVGLGLDAGYTLPNAIYVGGTAEYFFGDKQNVGGLEVSGNVWQIMGEGGYDIGLGDHLVIRPKLGLGLANSHGEVCSGSACNSDSSSDFALAPGATFMFFAPHFSAAVDLRYEVVLSDPTSKALILSLGIGF